MTTATLGSLIDNVIRESLAGGISDRTRKEQQLQQRLTTQCGGPSKNKKLSEKDQAGDDGKEKEGKSKDRIPEVDDVVEVLNAFRSGRSFRDDEIRSSFDNYYEALSDAEKIALYAFAKGISQIVTGEVSSEEASEPDDNPANVKMKRTEPDSRSIEPNVIKKASPPDEGKPTDNEEDTTPPSPITVK